MGKRRKDEYSTQRGFDFELQIPNLNVDVLLHLHRFTFNPRSFDRGPKDLFANLE